MSLYTGEVKMRCKETRKIKEVVVVAGDVQDVGKGLAAGMEMKAST